MSKTSIEWTDVTWNPTRGCSRVSEGCRNCYAEKIAARYSDEGQPFHLFAERNYTYKTGGSKTNWNPHWTGKVELIESKLLEPLHWKKPRRVFVNSMSDLWHEKLPREDIARCYAVMAYCQWHDFQVLTKRPDDRLDYRLLVEDVRELFQSLLAQHGPPQHANPFRWPLPNVWEGISVENQATADDRIPKLLQTPAAVRFVSYEPALGPVDFSKGLWLPTPGIHPSKRAKYPWLDWIIVGGESGHGARPFDVDWARSVICQCKAAGVPVFVKQLGSNPIGDECQRKCGYPDKIKLQDRKGGNWDEWPEYLRVREFPR